MGKQPIYLPISRFLNTAAFGGMLNDTTTSYKFLWLGAVIGFVAEETAERKSNSRLPQFAEVRIPFKSIVAEMFVMAHYPLNQFRLSFGKQDMMRRHIAVWGAGLQTEPQQAKVAAHFRRKAIPDDIYADVVKFVPYRALTPFFGDKLKGLLDREKNGKIIQLADETFGSDFPPFYRFDGNAVIVHPKWADYVADNLQIVRAWRELRWLHYLQKHNPSVPAIANKLQAPKKTESMGRQREFWKDIMAVHPVHCIYSEADLSAAHFVLDHYVPWHFYAHNHLWNLVPTTAAVNSAKSDKLPANNYYGKFLDMQHLAVRVLADSPDKWKTLRESYETGLVDAEGQGGFDILTDHANLKDRYDKVILPAIELAKSRGFAGGWEYGAAVL
ncbi:MAG: HNH endonuclease domain-containing protein [Gammaproteobacteria bacterium]